MVRAVGRPSTSRTAVQKRLRFKAALPLASLFGAVIPLLVLPACRTSTRPDPDGSLSPPALPAPQPAPPLPPENLAACERRRLEIEAEPDLPHENLTRAVRAEILGRARATPVYFAEVPTPSEALPARFRAMPARLEQAADPAAEILSFLRATRGDLASRRALFLHDGYLYAQSPTLALRLTQTLRLDHLFDAERLQIERGTEAFEAVREKGRYVRVDRDGRRSDATLLLYDRVRELEASAALAPLHLDFRDLQQELGFRSLEVVRATRVGLWVRFSYGGDPHDREFTIEGAVRREGARAVLDCELVPPEREEELLTVRELERSWFETFVPLRAAISKIVELRLPFDEPRTEYGQEDGQLRRAFREAYERGREVYEYNGDSYYVFDSEGRVRLPEVCIDFIADAFDWATGGSWAPRGRKRARVKGAFHLASLPIENPRSVESLITFATEHPSWFDLMPWKPEERVSFQNRPRFFTQLSAKARLLRLGDVVFINGLRSDERYHYHSFFITGLDPITGTPILLAANAGPPQQRTWEGEMAGAPRRFVVARLRVRPSVLAAAYAQAQTAPGVPLSLPEDPAEAVPAGPSSDALPAPTSALPGGG